MTTEKGDYQSALDEAQELMESLGGSDNTNININIDGFAIDSDEDEDNVPWDVDNIDTEIEITDAPLDPLSASMSTPSVRSTGSASASASASASNTSLGAGAQQQQPQPINMHPLQDDFLPMPMNMTMNGGTGTPTASEATASPNSSLHASSVHSNMNYNNNNNNNIANNSANNASNPGIQSQSHMNPHGNSNMNTAASLDAFKASTSRFANTFATFAQRAASQVVGGVVVPTTPTHDINNSSSTSPFYDHQQPYQINNNNNNSQQQQYTPTNSGSATQTQPTTTTTSSSSQGQGQGQAGVMPMQSIVPTSDLDNEQKATLIQTHVGDLLPGERVIMFLSNLLHVSVSRDNFQYSYSPVGSSSMWCCAMTYYRIILFSTHAPAAVSGGAGSGAAAAAAAATANYSTSSKPADWNAACWPPANRQPSILEMPLASMDKVERSAFTATTGGANGANPTTLMGLLLYGKDNGRQLRFTTPSYADTLRALEALQTYAFPGRRNLGYLFAFESKRTAVMDSIVTDGATGKKTVTLEPVRKRFDGVTEFERQFARGEARPWTVWNTINPSYQTCLSYPAVLAGPATLDEHNPEAQRTIRQCAAFRSEHRLPALTWSSGTDGASLWRCSQPKIGLQGNRSSADELFLKHILESASSANAMARDNAPPSLSRSMLVQLTGSGDIQNWIPEPGCGMKIVDLRPRSSAIANRTGGYGYENTSNYAGSTLQFCNIGNIHAVRDSYQKMSALCLGPSTQDVQWNALVEDTKWLSHIRLILSAAWESAFWVHVHRLPVLLHCSHGWDRTSQVAALAELLLDPFYRTREGFSCLVEKDFMSFGHPFHTRCAHGEGRGDAGAPSSGATSTDEGQISPIFLQFLDCVYQIVKLYPECFEFNTKYLITLSEHVYSCRFGNLLCDTERERELVAGIRQRTHSLWDYLDERKDTLNDSFSEATSSGVLLMPLPTLLRNVSLWTERHCMHGPKPTDRWIVE